MNRSIGLAIGVVALSCASVLHAQTPPAPKTVAVMVMMTPKPGAERPAGIISDEVKATVRLYLDGKIREWFAWSDGNGVIFIVDAKNAADAQALVETLPLARAHVVDFQYIALSPLAPLARLLDPGPAK